MSEENHGVRGKWARLLFSEAELIRRMKRKRGRKRDRAGRADDVRRLTSTTKLAWRPHTLPSTLPIMLCIYSFVGNLMQPLSYMPPTQS